MKGESAFFTQAAEMRATCLLATHAPAPITSAAPISPSAQPAIANVYGTRPALTPAVASAAVITPPTMSAKAKAHTHRAIAQMHAYTPSATAINAIRSANHTGEPRIARARSSASLRRLVFAMARGTTGRSSRMASAAAAGEPIPATDSSSFMPSSIRSAMASS